MIRKAVIIVLTLAAVGVLIPSCLSRITSTTESPWCWCSDFVWKGQVAFEYGHMFVYKHLPASGATTDWCDIRTSTGRANYWTNSAAQQAWNPGYAPRAFREDFLRRPGLLRLLSNSGSWCLVVPLWCLFLLFGAYPTYACLRGPVLRSWRRRRGLCVGCSYDLTGNESGTCPECGEGVSQQSLT